MPVWHEATSNLRKDGKVHVVGLIQEQHPDRCRLFMQWKQMDWPVLVDSINLLQVSAVPIALLLDEQGIVREVMRDPSNLAERLDALGANPAAKSNGEVPPPSNDVLVLQQAHDALLLSEPPNIDKALRVLDDALRQDDPNGALNFARGVAYRMRHDSPQRQRGDFAAAVADWQQALDIDPNQYIWRRRIQQYGPRLDKPYPFYNWIDQARTDIQARGETPAPIAVEPTETELAAPQKQFTQAADEPAEPDPDSRILLAKDMVFAEVAVVPPRILPGNAARVHVMLIPNPRAKAHWNNEGDPLVFWVNPPDGWSVSQRRLTISPPQQPVSDEPRSLEFEIRAPADAKPGTAQVAGYTLFGVCEGPTGACLYRRTNVTARIDVIEAP